MRFSRLIITDAVCVVGPVVPPVDPRQDHHMTESEDGAGQPPVGAGRPAVTRVLSAGAKRAERVAHAAGVDRALNQAAEEAILRALRSPAVLRALERAIETHDVTGTWRSEEIAQLVNRLLAADAAGLAWAQFLESEQAQMLVERIAGAPEIRAAIASQSAGLITDIGVRLTIITEEFDDAVERLVRPRDPDSETDQAGLATRLVAAGIDLALLFGVYSLISSVLASLVSAVFGQPLSLVAVIILSLLGVLAGGGFFAAFWALAGQTPGMRFLSIRLMHDGSAEITFGRAVRRVLALILALLPLGLGYLAILRDPRRRGWHDRLTGTEVIYDVVARAAPHGGSAQASAAAARHRSRHTQRPPSERST
jgi:uncharacterized RDD family membrane protein YckC